METINILFVHVFLYVFQSQILTCYFVNFIAITCFIEAFKEIQLNPNATKLM